MADLIDVLDAAYNVVRPSRDFPYPVLQDGKIVYLDPLSVFVYRNSYNVANVRKFIVSLSIIGTRVGRPADQNNLLINNQDVDLAALNVLDDSPSSSRVTVCMEESLTPDEDALQTISEVLNDIPPASWLSLDADTLRFTKSIVELANIVRVSTL